MNSQQRQQGLDEIGIAPYLVFRETFDVGELPIHCEVYPAEDPDQPVVLFIPGIGTYSELYAGFLHRLSGCGYNVVGIDPRGHGYSGGPRGLYSINQVVNDIQLVIDALRRRYRGPLILFGSSFGARLALAVAESAAAIDLLVCHTLFLNERPPDMLHRLGWNWVQFNSMIFPWMPVDFRQFIDVKSLLGDTPLADFAENDERMVWRYPLTTLGSVYGASSQVLQKPIGVPALVVVGEHDQIISATYLRGLVDHSASPFDLQIIPKAGHMLPFFNIEETLQSVDGWVRAQL